MKNIIKRLPKRLLAFGMAVVLVATLTATATAAFGPDRPTKAWSPTVDGFDHVTFNSFTGVGNGIGDERDFFRGVQVGRDSVWSDPVQNVTQDAEVEGKVYIHNNADARLNDQPGNPGIAKDVNVRVAMPTGTKQSQDATAYISATNAQPTQVFDTLTMTGANNGFFAIDYVPGSAQLHKNGQTTALSDNLVTSGVNLGDQKGCFDFVQEVTFRMKVKMPRYTITKQVGIPGQTSADWKKNLPVKKGETVSWLVTFTNAGRTELKSVKIVDEIPVGLTVVPGTVKLTNGNYLSGYIFPDGAIQAKGRQINIDIGNYNPDGIAYVTFKTVVDQAEQPTCEANTILNRAYATPEGFGSITDTASVSLAADKCQPVTPPVTPAKVLPNTGAGDVVAMFTAITIAGAIAHRVYMVRRLS
jgi:uncharacterized repeat protein (TIGR01451 family)